MTREIKRLDWGENRKPHKVTKLDWSSPKTESRMSDMSSNARTINKPKKADEIKVKMPDMSFNARTSYVANKFSPANLNSARTIDKSKKADETDNIYNGIDVGGYHIGPSNVLQNRKSDNFITGLGKNLVNAAVGFPETAINLLGLAGEGIRQASVQGGGLINGKGFTPYNGPTSFTKDVMPEKWNESLASFEKNHPVLGGITRTGIDIGTDPLTYVGGGGIVSEASKAKSMINTTKGLTQLSSDNAKILSKLKRSQPLSTAEHEIVKANPDFFVSPQG